MIALTNVFATLNLSDKESSFYIYSVMKYTRNFLFNSMHKDWYVCQEERRKAHGMEVLLDFYDGEPDVLDRCTFLAHPVSEPERKLRNCKHVLGPAGSREINGQPLPHPPHLVPRIPPPPPVVVPPCMPVCPAGPMGGAAARPPSAGKAAVTVTSTHGIASVSTSSRRKLVD